MAYYSCVERSEYGEKGGSDNIEFNIDHGDAESGGGACSSPPLWGDSKMSNNKKMMRSARVEAIARGQKELMEMVKSMPDSSYELSLRDLVDHHQKLGFQQNNNKKKKQASVRKLQGSSRQTSTSKNYKTGGGLLLKMVFPALPLGATQKSKEIPTYSHTTTAAGGFSSHGSTGSSDTTVTVSSNSTRKKGGLLCGCSPFHSNKKKIVE